MSETPERFTLRQKVTLMVNRYELRALAADGTEGPLLATAQQKRMAFKEQVTFYSDEARTQPMFGFLARKRLDLAATYDVTDAQGARSVSSARTSPSRCCVRPGTCRLPTG